jgi:hypothetical protein
MPAVFQAQTATGKLNADIIPTTPIGGGTAHTYGVQSALLNVMTRKTYCKIADIDHFLHFTISFL